ncbi:MAG: shikimate dehydrogenase [Bacteroidota bacterium]
MPTFGLLGYPLSHSFSQAYFSKKFERMALTDSHQYLNFEYKRAVSFFNNQLPKYSSRAGDEIDILRGINVTIPHKRKVIEYIDGLSPSALEIGAVNTILFLDGHALGFNTDHLGFTVDLKKMLGETQPERALVLGTGGAAKAIQYACEWMGIAVQLVSRRVGPDRIRYRDLDREIISSHQLIINTTPLGTFPNVSEAPDLPYGHINDTHYCYDLVYNPAQTHFLTLAAQRGAKTQNGLGMLIGQAEAAWQIWTNERKGRTST